LPPNPSRYRGTSSKGGLKHCNLECFGFQPASKDLNDFNPNRRKARNATKSFLVRFLGEQKMNK